VSKVAADQRGPARPYGSVFVQSLARSVWELRRSEEESEDLVISLSHRKANRGRLHAPIGFWFAFDDDTITLHRALPGRIQRLMARASLPQQIRAALSNGPKTAEALTVVLRVSHVVWSFSLVGPYR